MLDARTDRYIRLITRKPFKVVISFITLVAFLFNTVSYDIAWADRTPSALTSVSADNRAVSPVSPGAFKELSVNTFVLPQSLGTIKDSWQPAVIARTPSEARGTKQSQTTVIHIQDAHCNYYAQHAISDIIEYLNKEYGINEINLEGGAKDYDLSIFTSIKDESARERVADYFVKEGLVNGAEYFAVNNPGKAKLWGIEDTKLYIDNLRVYRNSLKYKADTDKLLHNLSNILTNLKMKLYSKELLELDMKYNQYKADSLEFKDYLNYLIANAKERLINIKSFNNIFLLSQSLKAEGEIDFGKANSQRDELIDKLQKRLSKNAMKDLVEKTVAFRAGLIPQEEFYASLLNKAKSANISIENYPELEKYIVYISTYAAVDKAKIIDEVTALETRLREILYQNDKQRELDKLSKNLAILKNIFNVSLTRADYGYYKANEASFDMKNYISFIDSCRGGLNLPYNGVNVKDLKRLDGYREDMGKFYEYSFKRDVAFLKNLVIARPAKQAEAISKSAILITGGFHTDNLTELLKKQGTSYISIIPNFRNSESYECPYIKVLSAANRVNLTKAVPIMLAGNLAPPPPRGINKVMDKALDDAFGEGKEPLSGITPTLPAPETSIVTEETFAGATGVTTLGSAAAPSAVGVVQKGPYPEVTRAETRNPIDIKKLYNTDSFFLTAIEYFNSLLRSDQPMRWSDAMEIFRLYRSEKPDEKLSQKRLNALSSPWFNGKNLFYYHVEQAVRRMPLSIKEQLGLADSKLTMVTIQESNERANNLNKALEREDLYEILRPVLKDPESWRKRKATLSREELPVFNRAMLDFAFPVLRDMKKSRAQHILDLVNTKVDPLKTSAARREICLRLALEIYSDLGEQNPQLFYDMDGFDASDGSFTDIELRGGHPASGHHRLAWFCMNFFLIKNGMEPVYFQNEEEYRNLKYERSVRMEDLLARIGGPYDQTQAQEIAAPAAAPSAAAKPAQPMGGQMKPLSMGTAEDAGFTDADRDKFYKMAESQKVDEELTKEHDLRQFKLSAKVISADFGKRMGNVGAYHFVRNGILVIVLNKNLHTSDIKDEAKFHEAREALWMAKGYDQRQAHIIASAEQSQDARFQTEDGVTYYQAWQLENMSVAERQTIIDETAEFREWHKAVVEDAISKGASVANIGQVTDQETLLRKAAKDIQDARATRAEIVPLPTPVEDKALAKNIEPLLKNKRALITTDSVDAIDQALAFQARKRKVNYLRLTLNDQREMDRLLASVNIKDGSFETRAGSLMEIIKEGGILLIDYSGSASQFMEQLNSLFDKDPYFGDGKASKDLIVVGVTNEKQYAASDSTFRSRFEDTVFIKAGYIDTIGMIRAPPQGAVHETAELSGSPNFRDELLGSVHLDEHGKLQIREGTLVKAIRVNKPILIKGDNWNNPDFLLFIRQIILHGEVEFNGERMKLPEGFTIYRQPGNYGEDIANKRIIANKETQLGGENAWVINSQNQDALFSRTHVINGKLTQLEGLLERERLRIRIVGKLDDWVWHNIMHSGAEVEIEIDPSCYIPPVYNPYRSAGLKKAVLQETRKTWDTVRRENVVFIEGDDLDFVRAQVQKDLGGNVIIYPVTPETTLSQLASAIGIKPGSIFEPQERGFIRALKDGKTVILEGIESNPALLADISTALSENPYIMENGNPLYWGKGGLQGRLIVTSRLQKAFPVAAENHVIMQLNDDAMEALVKGRFPSIFKHKDFEKILQLKKIFQDIPAPSISGLYPNTVNLSFARICMLYMYNNNWLDAFENVIISNYRDAPEIAAFMRVMVRDIFNQEEEAHQPNTIHGRKLMGILNNMKPHEQWDKYFWQLVDTLSLSDVKKMKIGTDYLKPSIKDVFNMIQKALVKNSDGENRKFYKHVFGISDDSAVADAPRIDYDLRSGEENWQQRKERIIRILQQFNSVFFRGPPGTGKSYVAEQIAGELGYAPDDVVGPVTTGVDASESGVVGASVYEGGQTLFRDEAIGRWIPTDRSRKGKLFIVDEANLTKPQFWNFLKAFFNTDPSERYVWVNGERRYFITSDRIIFTGNQETLPGRQFTELLQEFVITVNFPQFDTQFLRSRLEEYVHENKYVKEDLVDFMVEIHSVFEQMNPTIDFSLRDLQEFASRVNMFMGAQWTKEGVALIAWKQYCEIFSANEAEAIRHIMKKKFGIDVVHLESAELDKIIKEKGAGYQAAGVTLVESAARTVSSVGDFLRMREARLNGKTLLQGKRGMIFEGPSGRGKDAVLTQILQDNSIYDFKTVTIVKTIIAGIDATNMTTQQFVDAIIARVTGIEQKALIAKALSKLTKKISEYASIDGDFGIRTELLSYITNPTRIYYHVNASSRIDEIISIIKEAQTKGSAVIISEMNLLPTAFLEGRLNDVLTGRAHQGFALFATMNSMDFSGREKLSSALQNRTLYQKIPDYTQEELNMIAQANGAGIAKEEIAMLVNAHVWIRQNVSRQNQRPTTRELLNALKVIRTEHLGWRKAVDRIYGPFYLERVLSDKKMPPDKELRNFKEQLPISNEELMRLIGTFISGRPVPKINMDAVTKQGGSHGSLDNSITLSTKSTIGYQLETVDHEAGHGRFTRDIAGLVPIGDDPFWGLYMWLEDCRMEHAVKKYFPYASLDTMSKQEEGFVAAVKTINTEYLYNAMTPQDLFKYILSSFAKGFITKEEIDNLARAMGDDEMNIVTLASKHLEAARRIYESIPDTLDEEEIRLQQYLALEILQSMKEDYMNAYVLYTPLTKKEEAETKAPPIEKQKEAVDRANETLSRERLEPAVEKPKLKAEAPVLSAKEVEKRIEKSRQEAEDNKRKAKEVQKEEVLKELKQMEDDLAQGCTMGRLNEMRAQLESNHWPASIALRIKVLKDKDIDEVVAGILAGITLQIEAHEEMKLNPLPAQAGAGIGGAGLGFGEAGTGESLVEARYGTRITAHAETHASNPISITEAKPKPAVRTLSSRETEKRNDLMRKISGEQRPILDKAIQDFFKHRLSVERVYGQEGALDVQRFLRNPTAGFYRSGGIEEKTAKELILSGIMKTTEWNPILDELFYFLFENGFHITVYTSSNSYVSGIRTLADLKTILAEAGDTSAEKVADDLSSRKRREDYEYVSVKDLQKKVEAAYLYGAFRTAARGEKMEEAPAETDFDREVKIVNSLVKKHIVQGRTTNFVDPSTKEISLDFAGRPAFNNADLEELSRCAHITILDLADTGMTRIDSLARIRSLKKLNLHNASISLDDIYSLFDDHPNRRELQVTDASGSFVVDYANYIQHKVMKEERYDNEVKLIDAFLTGRESHGSWDHHNLKMWINLSNCNVTDENILTLSQCSHIDSLDLSGNKGVTDISPLAKIRGLKNLNLTDTPAALDTDAIWKLFENHPNRRNLKVTVSANEIIEYHDYLEELGGDKADFVTKTKELEEIFVHGGVDIANLYIDYDEQTVVFTASDPWFNDNTLSSLISYPEQIALIMSLGLRGTKVKDLTPLMGMTKLRNLYLDIGKAPSNITMDQVWELFRTHPNKENLVVSCRQDGAESVFNYADYLEHIKAATRELNREEQKNKVIEFLSKRNANIPASFFPSGANTYTLDLSRLKDKLTDTDLNELSGLTIIGHLTIEGQGISDLSLLRNMKNLQTLFIKDTSIRDLSPLAGLSHLDMISITDTPLDNEAVRVLSTLPEGRHLTLKNIKGIDDIIELRKAANLQFLILGGTNVANENIIELLLDHPNGKRLDVSNKDDVLLRYDDIPQDLKQVEVEENLNTQIREAEKIIGKYVVDPNPIVEILLSDLPTPGMSLNLGGLPPAVAVSILMELGEYRFSNLDAITAPGVQLGNLSCILPFRNVKSLDLSNTGIKDITPLLKLKDLTDLRVEGLGLTNKEIDDFFQQHPNMKNLTVDSGSYIVSYGEDLTKGKKVAEEAVAGEKRKGTLLAHIVNALVDPNNAFEFVKKRFEDEGSIEDFNKVVTELGNNSAIKKGALPAVMPVAPSSTPAPAVTPSATALAAAKPVVGSNVGSWFPDNEEWTSRAWLKETGAFLFAGGLAWVMLSLVGLQDYAAYVVPVVSALTFQGPHRTRAFNPTVAFLTAATLGAVFLLITNPILGVMATIGLIITHRHINLPHPINTNWKEALEGPAPAMVVFDLDGTLSGSGGNASEDMIAHINDLLSRGIKVAVITGSRWDGGESARGRYPSMKERLWSRIRSDLRANLLIFSDMSQLWKFDENPEDPPVKPIPMNNDIKIQLQNKVEEILKNKYGVDAGKVPFSNKPGSFSTTLIETDPQLIKEGLSKALSDDKGMQALIKEINRKYKEDGHKGQVCIFSASNNPLFAEFTMISKAQVVGLAREHFDNMGKDARVIMFGDSMQKEGNDRSIFEDRENAGNVVGICVGDANIPFNKNIYKGPTVGPEAAMGPASTEMAVAYLLRNLPKESPAALAPVQQLNDIVSILNSVKSKGIIAGAEAEGALGSDDSVLRKEVYGVSIGRMESTRGERFPDLEIALYGGTYTRASSVAVFRERPNQRLTNSPHWILEDRMRNGIVFLQHFNSVDEMREEIEGFEDTDRGLENTRKGPVNLTDINAIFVPEHLVEIVTRTWPEYRNKIVPISKLKDGKYIKLDEEFYDDVYDFEGAILAYMEKDDQKQYAACWLHGMRLPAPSDYKESVAALIAPAAAKPAQEGARKNIVDADEGLSVQDREALLVKRGMGREISGKIVEGESISYVMIEYNAIDEIGKLFAKRGIAGAYNATLGDGTTYVFVQEGLADAAMALEHEDLEIAWRKMLERSPPENMTIEQAAHILAWARQIMLHGWTSADSSTFILSQIRGMTPEQLQQIITADRSRHQSLARAYLGDDAARSIEQFELSVNALAKERASSVAAAAPSAAPLAALSDAAVKAQEDFAKEFGKETPDVLRFISNKEIGPDAIESYKKELIQERQGREVSSHELTIMGLGTVKFYTKRNNRLPAEFAGFGDEASVMSIAHQNGLGPNAMTIRSGEILVMQEAKGKRLDEILLDETLSPEKRAQITGAVMYALGRLHGLKIFHGDIVQIGLEHNVLIESNIIISEDGRAIFIDFANALTEAIEKRRPRDEYFAEEKEAIIDALRVENEQKLLLKEAYERGKTDTDRVNETNKETGERIEEYINRLLDRLNSENPRVKDGVMRLFDLARSGKETVQYRDGLKEREGINHLKALLVGVKPGWLNFAGLADARVAEFLQNPGDAGVLHVLGLEYIPTVQGPLLYNRDLVKAILKRDGAEVNKYLKDKKINFDQEDEKKIIEEMLKADMHLIGIVLGYRLEDVIDYIELQSSGKLIDLGVYVLGSVEGDVAGKHPGLIEPFAQAQSVAVVRENAEAALESYLPVQVGVNKFEETYNTLRSGIAVQTPALPATVSIAKPIIEKSVILSEVDEITGALNEKFEDHGYPVGFANAAIQAFCTEMLQNVDRAGREAGTDNASARVLLYEYDDELGKGLKISISNNAAANMEAINHKLGMSAEDAAKELVKAGGTGEEGIGGGLGIALVNGMAEKLGGKVESLVDNGWTHVVMSIPRPGAVATALPPGGPVSIEQLKVELANLINDYSSRYGPGKTPSQGFDISNLAVQIKQLLSRFSALGKFKIVLTTVHELDEKGSHTRPPISAITNTREDLLNDGDSYYAIGIQAGEGALIFSMAVPVRVNAMTGAEALPAIGAQANKANAAQANVTWSYRNWVITPMFDKTFQSKRFPIDKAMSRLYKQYDGATTSAKYYLYKAGDTADELAESFRATFRDLSKDMAKVPESLDPRAVLYAPSVEFEYKGKKMTGYEIAKEVLGEDEFSNINARVHILSDNVPDVSAGIISEAQHIDLGVEWLDYIRRVNNNSADEAYKKTLADHIRTCVDPKDATLTTNEILDGIRNGTIALKMIGPVDWDAWDKEQKAYIKLRQAA